MPAKRGTIIGVWNEILVLKWLLSYANSQLSAYDTSLTQDLEKLKNFHATEKGFANREFEIHDLTCTNYLVLEKRV